MRRLLRWQFVLPRLLMVVVVLLAVQYVLCLMARSRTVQTIEAALGTRAEVGTARVSFIDGQVILGNLCVANPRRPMQNLFEAERCDLVFDTSTFLRRRTLVGRGEVTGLRFGTPRTASGARSDAPNLPSSSGNWFAEDHAQLTDAWLHELGDRFQRPRVEEFESVRRTEELLADWPSRFAAIERRVSDLQERADELRERAAAADENPLRGEPFYTALPTELAALQAHKASLAAEVEKLSDEMETERRAIVAARRRDEQRVREQLSVDAPDAGPMTAYLLNEQASGPLAEIVGWLQWARHIAPAAQRHSGKSAESARSDQSPGLLLHSLTLDGNTTTLGGKSVRLRGTLTDFTTAPGSLDRPMRLRLTSVAPGTVDLSVTIDRSGPVARDELLFDVRGLALPSLELGRPDGLLLSVAPSVGTLNVSVVLEGDQLSGEIQWVQGGTRITPRVGEDLGHVPLVASLADVRRDVGSVATRLTLGGTINEPRCTLWSNLGPAVSEALDRAAGRAADEHVRQLLAKAQQQVDERLAQLDRKIAEGRADLLPRLADSGDRLEGLAAQYAVPARLDVEYLGRRLPAHSLFR